MDDFERAYRDASKPPPPPMPPSPDRYRYDPNIPTPPVVRWALISLGAVVALVILVAIVAHQREMRDPEYWKREEAAGKIRAEREARLAREAAAGPRTVNPEFMTPAAKAAYAERFCKSVREVVLKKKLSDLTGEDLRASHLCTEAGY